MNGRCTLYNGRCTLYNGSGPLYTVVQWYIPINKINTLPYNYVIEGSLCIVYCRPFYNVRRTMYTIINIVQCRQCTVLDVKRKTYDVRGILYHVRLTVYDTLLAIQFYINTCMFVLHNSRFTVCKRIYCKIIYCIYYIPMLGYNVYDSRRGYWP